MAIVYLATSKFCRADKFLTLHLVVLSPILLMLDYNCKESSTDYGESSVQTNRKYPSLGGSCGDARAELPSRPIIRTVENCKPGSELTLNTLTGA